MEKKKDKKRALINELTQGKELTNQLKNHLDKDTSLEACEYLVEKIVSSYGNALSILNWNVSLLHQTTFPLEYSPHNSFVENSPTSDNSDFDSNDQCKKNVSKKRKIMPKWSEQVKVSSRTMTESPLGDGYSWRKYGQKDILGANFPRAYYRCTHRNVLGCLATKQVQKSDEDPLIVEVSYRGRHTCSQATHLATAFALATEKKAQSPNKEHKILESQTQDMNLNFGTCLKAKEMEKFPSFSFPSAPIESGCMEESFFWESINMEDNFVGSYSYSPSFVFRAQNVQSSDSDLTDIVSAPTSNTNSPMVDFDHHLDELDFDSKFFLDNILESELFY